MVIMVSLNQNSIEIQKVRCLVRHEWMKATPEEIVRQKLLQKMLEEWGYPHSLILVEKALSELPGIKNSQKLPRRRMDVVSYAKNSNNQLTPLIVIECKAACGLPSAATTRQLLGYNYHIGAPFVGIIGGDMQLQVFSAVTSLQIFTHTYTDLLLFLTA
jgi:hypothetical protein